MKIFERIKKFCVTDVVISNTKIIINGEEVKEDDPRYQKIRKDFKNDMREFGEDMKKMAKDLENML